MIAALVPWAFLNVYKENVDLRVMMNATTNDMQTYELETIM
jgi:hypothetical protein